MQRNIRKLCQTKYNKIHDTDNWANRRTTKNKKKAQKTFRLPY